MQIKSAVQAEGRNRNVRSISLNTGSNQQIHNFDYEDSKASKTSKNSNDPEDNKEAEEVKQSAIEAPIYPLNYRQTNFRRI